MPGIVAWVMRPLPLLPLQIALERLLAGILERHPDLTSRLSGIERRPVAVDPNDLPFIIVLEPHDGTMSLRVVRTLENERMHARICGSVSALIGLVDGVYDGDALFFSRDLIIEGDIEAVLALRNAIDDADIDLLGEVTATWGLPAAPFERVARGFTRLLRIAVAGNDVSKRGNVQ
jgi:predicted lipid carrier protein YhbT